MTTENNRNMTVPQQVQYQNQAQQPPPIQPQVPQQQQQQPQSQVPQQQAPPMAQQPQVPQVQHQQHLPPQQGLNGGWQSEQDIGERRKMIAKM